MILSFLSQTGQVVALISSANVMKESRPRALLAAGRSLEQVSTGLLIAVQELEWYVFEHQIIVVNY